MSADNAWVLVVDDDPGIRELVRDVLELADYGVVTAEYGSAGLAALRAGVPACVVLDVMMPGMSGIEVLAAIRAEPAWRDLPVVMLTAATDDTTTWAGWQGGASCFLPKPFDPSELLDWVDRLTGRTGAAPTPEPEPDTTHITLPDLPQPRVAVDTSAMFYELAALAGRFS